MKYIDAHCHIFPDNIAAKVVNQLETYYGYSWECNGMIDNLLESIQQVNINKCIIFSCATKASQVQAINDYISGLQNDHPDKFIGFASMHQDFEDYENEIARVKRLGLRGFKFHPDFQQFNIDDPKALRIYEKIDPDVPLLFHCGDPNTDFSSPKRLANMLRIFPEHKIIAAHLGGYSKWEESWKYLVGKNVYFDITSCRRLLPVDEMKKIIRAHGVDKVLFGSDYPSIHHRHAVNDLLSLGLSNEENEMIFYRNAEKLLNITL